jgi:ABC-type amino acid transport substrate-binding protein
MVSESDIQMGGTHISRQNSPPRVKENKIKITSPKELKNYKIVTYSNDTNEQILIKKFEIKTENLHRSSHQIYGLIRVYKGRNDLFVGSQTTVDHLCRKQEYDRKLLESVFTLGSKDISFAFHKNTKARIIDLFQIAFDKLKAQGKLKELFQKYQVDPPYKSFPMTPFPEK